MAAISELRGQISSQQQQVQKSKQSIQEAKEAIPDTTQRQLRGQTAPSGLAGRTLQRKLSGARGEVSEAEKALQLQSASITKAEAELEAYLRTDSGKLQYAKEQGIKGRPIYGKLAKGYANEILAYEYSTPYGVVVDRSPEYKLREMEAKLSAAQDKQLDTALQTGGFIGSGVVFTKGGDLDPRFENLASQRLQQNVASISPPLQLQTRIETIKPTYLAGRAEQGITVGVPTVDPSKEYYDPRLNLFIKTEASPLKKTVEVTRTPSVEERISYNRIVGGDTSKMNILSVNLEDFSKQSKTYGSAQTSLVELSTGKELVLEDIERLGGSVIRDGDSYRLVAPTDPKKLKQYNTLVRQLQNLEGREQVQLKKLQSAGGSISSEGLLLSPTIQTGIGSYTRQTPVTEFSGLGSSFFVQQRPQNAKDLVIAASRTVSAPFTVLGITAGSVTGINAQRKLERLGVGEIVSARTLNVPELPEMLKRKISANPLGANLLNLSPKTVSIGSVNPESIGRAVGGTTRAGVEIGKYFIPVAGNAIFASEIAGSFAESDFSASKFIRDKPLQATILGGIAAYKITKYATKAIKASKYGKYIAKPEAKIVNLKTRQIENVMKESRIRPRVNIRQEETLNRLGVSARKKGLTKTTEYYPSKDLSGKVYEVRDLGRIRVSYNKGKIRFEKALKEFEGTARVSAQGKYVEEVIYDKGISKVTEIGKSGKGTIQLFKDGKLITKTKIKSEPFAELGRLKSKTEQIQVDKQFMDKELKSTLVKGKIEQRVGVGKNIQTGEFNVQIGRTGYTDIIESGPRKGMLQIKGPKGNIVIKAQKGQRIEYGIDKSYDYTKGVSKEGRMILKKNIGPTVQRELSSGSEAQVILGYVNPKSTVLKSARQVEKLKNKQWAGIIKEIRTERVKTMIESNILSKIRTINDKISSLKVPSFGGGKSGLIETSSPQALRSAYQYGSPEYYATLTKFGISPTAMPKLGSKVFVPAPSVSMTTIPQINLPVPTSTSYALINAGTKSVSVGADRLAYGLATLGATTTSSRIDTGRLEVLKNDLAIDATTSPDLKIDTRIDTQFDTSLSQDIKQDLKLKLDLTQDLQTRQGQDQRLSETLQENLRNKEVDLNLDINLPKSGEGKVKKAQGIIKGFEAFARTKGQDISIGEFGTLRQAKISLARELKSTLKASGFVTKSGKKLKADELGLYGKEFRVSKKDPYRVVQKRSYRLGSTPEVREIQYFKKAKGGKSRKKGFSFI